MQKAAQQIVPTINQPRLERPRPTADYLRISLSTLWHWSKTKDGFPRPIKAGQRVTLFDLNAIDAWLQNQREVA